MVTGQKQSTVTPFYPIQFPNSKTFPYTLPNISVAFQGNPPSDIEDQIKAAGGARQQIKGTMVYLIRNPDIALVQILMMVNGINKFCPAPDQFVNLSCLSYIALTRKIFSAFFKLNYYPAFRDENHLDDMERLELVKETAGQKRGATEPPAGSTRSKKKGTGTSTDLDDDMDDDSIAAAQVHSDRIKWALPNSSVDTVGWGAAAALGTIGGLWCPYVPELLSYDGKMVVEILVKYFSGCLGTNITEVKEMISGFKSAFGVIKSSEVGKVLSHMAKCIDIGIQAQARIFPIFSGEIYEGCVLSGFGFTVVMESKMFKALPPSELTALLQTANRSSNSIEAISRLAGVGTGEISSGKDRVDTLMPLKRLLADKGLSEQVRDEVRKLAGHISVGPRWPLNPATLTRALDLLVTGLWKDLPDDLPIGHGMLFETDVTSVVWSCFGEMAPSTRFSGQPMKNLGSRDFPKHIGFSQRVLPEAISDIKEVLRTKMIAVPSLNRRSTIHKDRIFEGSSASSILASLRKAAGAKVVDQTEGNTLPVGVPSVNLLVDI
jgi:hypothetical protein